jgi:hypothetical protein
VPVRHDVATTVDDVAVVVDGYGLHVQDAIVEVLGVSGISGEVRDLVSHALEPGEPADDASVGGCPPVFTAVPVDAELVSNADAADERGDGLPVQAGKLRGAAGSEVS